MGSGKAYKGVGMEGWIATWYARNALKDMAEYQRLADRLAGETPPQSRILEVAPGPGFLSIELARRGPFEITGLDISTSFVDIAGKNAAKEGVHIDFQAGDASAMPFADDAFDLIVCRAAFKNFARPREALDEMFRVLSAGGRAIIIDLRRDVSFPDIAAYADRMGMGPFSRVLTKPTFRYMLIPRASTMDEFRKMASDSRFGGCDMTRSPIGMEVILRKRKGAL